MASFAAARSVFRSSSSLRSAATNVASHARSSRAPSFYLPKRGGAIAQAPRFLRSPLEMSSFCVESLLPMHSVTASAVMTSLLAVSRRGYGWLSEGQDETR
ncbi:protein NUCLEAR FUSION DEFECTIVE 6, mitochondrial-like isoform X1 [Carex rostrata]